MNPRGSVSDPGALPHFYVFTGNCDPGRPPEKDKIL